MRPPQSAWSCWADGDELLGHAVRQEIRVSCAIPVLLFSLAQPGEHAAQPPFPPCPDILPLIGKCCSPLPTYLRLDHHGGRRLQRVQVVADPQRASLYL